MDFNLKKYWQDRYVSGGNSGAGSYGDEAIFKANFINHWIEELGINTITEIGSGDANNLLLYKVNTSYCGYDISEKAVEISNEKTKRIHNGLKYFFTSKLNEIDYDAKLCLCLDVFYHQVNDDDFNALFDLIFKKGNWKYVIVYTAEYSNISEELLGNHMKYREIQSKVAALNSWELMHWISGYSNDKLPSNKRFFLFERND